jgi:hypothetical protein
VDDKTPPASKSRAFRIALAPVTKNPLAFEEISASLRYAVAKTRSAG